MDYKLAVSFLALVVSAISIYLSIKSNTFNRRLKSTEMRSNVLMKFAEVGGKVSEAKDYLTQVKIEAEEENDLKLYKLASHIDSFERISMKVNILHDKAKKTDLAKSVEMYENIFHELHGIIIDTENEVANTRNRVENYKAKNRKELPA